MKKTNRRKMGSEMRKAALAVLLSSPLAGPALAAGSAGLYQHSAMKEVGLSGLRVWLGKPIQVTAQIGWGTTWAHSERPVAWCFTRLAPFLAKFPRGNVIATYVMDSDSNEDPFFLSGFQISKDGGAHWGRRYGTLIQHISMVFIPQEHDSLMALPSEIMYRAEGDRRNFVGPYYRFEEGGAKVVMVPDGFQLIDWPWPTRLDPCGGRDSGSPQPPDNWHVGLYITGSVLKVGQRWIASIYGYKGDAPFYSSMLIASQAKATTWRYYSTISDADPSLAEGKGFEGPCETSFIQLADGDLMAVFRVGNGKGWPIYRSYSHDGGRTWTKPDALPAESVEPQAIRISNGTIALSTGRPGIFLWLATDPRATSWQKLDLLAYHNSVMEDPSARITSFLGAPYPSTTVPAWPWPTTSCYTAMVETAPNRILFAYDRDPERQPLNDKDLSRLFVLPIEIERR